MAQIIIEFGRVDNGIVGDGKLVKKLLKKLKNWLSLKDFKSLKNL